MWEVARDRGLRVRGLNNELGGVAAVVRSSTFGPLNNRTNKRNKERGVKTIELLHIAIQ